LLAELAALEPVMDGYFDGLPENYAVELHCGAMGSAIIVQINWLFDLLLHGEDIARAVGAPFEIHERDMLLMLREGMELIPSYVNPGLSLRSTSAWPWRSRRHDRTSSTSTTGSQTHVRAAPTTGPMPS
jgi:hypothetical protein